MFLNFSFLSNKDGLKLSTRDIITVEALPLLTWVHKTANKVE